MSPYRFLANSVFYKFVIFIFAISVLDCGLALGYQSEEAAKASQENNNDPILAALGLSFGGSGLINFSIGSSQIISTSGSVNYTITVPKWPTSDSGQIDLIIEWVSEDVACLDPSPGTFSFVSDQQYPRVSSTITFSCGKTGSGKILHTVTSAPESATSLVGTSLGDISVTITP
ncbi:hypothetical protein [Leptospira neocaledonica]|uniref:Uncharacterized protein n=1 Tax=Leptospira neocaledonica TaxID=2023192 RepID=A0A2M9ZYK6_9LEPT|nr:hypothetical protein [Leptospira neocaledonica]PJZ77119.1 hypothetical protein CH365_10205 [Leptospira neocaledonica]